MTQRNSAVKDRSQKAEASKYVVVQLAFTGLISRGMTYNRCACSNKREYYLRL